MGKSKTPETPAPPKLVRRRENKKSTFQLGRTIGEKREKLETANERALARKKDKKKKALRILVTVFGFVCLTVILAVLFTNLINGSNEPEAEPTEVVETKYEPTVEIVDGGSTGGKITTRMKDYIGRAEKDFRDLGYKPVKVVIPRDSIREVDFYLEEKPGYIKLTIDRDSAVSVEDADRMLRYLIGNGVETYEYIDVRIERKAYWK